jgi:hypothetical protein
MLNTFLFKDKVRSDRSLPTNLNNEGWMVGLLVNRVAIMKILLVNRCIEPQGLEKNFLVQQNRAFGDKVLIRYRPALGRVFK